MTNRSALLVAARANGASRAARTRVARTRVARTLATRNLAALTRAALTLAALTLAVACTRTEPLVDLGAVPAWSFTDQTGAAIGSASLRGRPWVASFLFTSCPSSCPELARATAALQKRVRAWSPAGQPPAVQLVSISVDPITDTVERLAAFATTYGADESLWKLATGPYDQMEALVTDGFMLPILRADLATATSAAEMQAARERPTPLDTAHSLRFVLVDAEGHIRGLFERNEAELERLDRALRGLAGR